MELLKHVAQNHYKKSDPHEKIIEVDATGNIEEIKTNKNSDHIEEVDEFKITKITESMETVDNKEKEKSFVFSESQFFDEFL